jgi:hypothetical protein
MNVDIDFVSRDTRLHHLTGKAQDLGGGCPGASHSGDDIG